MFPHPQLAAGVEERTEARLNPMTAAAVYQRNRIASYHGPIREESVRPSLLGFPSHQSSQEVSELTSAHTLFSTACCQHQHQLFPNYSVYGEDDRLMKQASVDNQESAAATDEINRNLDLLTQKVTELAIEESDSPSE